MSRQLLAWCEEYGVEKGWEWWDANRPGEPYPLPCQPINSYSSLAFCVAGVALWFSLSLRKKPECNALFHPLTRVYVCLTVIIMGPLSWLGHACIGTVGSLTSAGANADQMGLWLQFYLMAALLIFRVFVFLKFRRQGSTSEFPYELSDSFTSCTGALAGMVGVQLCLAFFSQLCRVVLEGFSNTVAYILYGVLLLISLGGEAWLQVSSRTKLVPFRRYLFLILAAGTLFVAMLFWILDMTQVLCDPNSGFQGHAFWHVAVSTAVFTWYNYLGRETWVVGPRQSQMCAMVAQDYSRHAADSIDHWVETRTLSPSNPVYDSLHN